MPLDKSRRLLGPLAAVARRVLAFYVGPIERNTIEYWQRSIFHVIALAGLVAGTLCIIPVCAWLAATGRPLGLVLLVPYAINAAAILAPRLSLTTKTLVIALNFYVFAVLSLIFAGPEGNAGVLFSVCVLLLSLFINFRAAFLVACLDLATEMVFAVLHAKGLIGWRVLVDFRFFSWVIQAGTIFLMNLTFAIANARLIRGVAGSFQVLKRAEESARDLLEEQARLKNELKVRLFEKEVLLRELHHRVKNNLQMIASLMNIRGTSMREPRLKDAFTTIQTQVEAISRIHVQLYQSENFAVIDFGDYLQELVRDLVIIQEETRIETVFELENIPLEIETAIPCALIANELITNSMKHAFRGRASGRMTISLLQPAADLGLLAVEDDGGGIPEETSPEQTRTLGMILIATLVSQLRGSLRIGGPRRNRVEISFPIASSARKE